MRVLRFGKDKAGPEFWALKDVNLEVEPGTALGIVGHNGAGKTTLLQIICGVLQPTSGMVKVNGRLVALFYLGAGFEEEFTGRENVMLNGLILGIERKEMLERLDEIEAFAEIGEFVDQPLKTYSSGMRARLGFAVAVSVEPDILLVDETLSTGDASFQAKGLQKMRELRDSGTTILFVSHSADQVKEFCTEAVLLQQGTLMFRGDTGEVIDHYEALLSNAAAQRDGRPGLQGAPDHETAWDGEDGLGLPDSKKTSVPGGKSSSLRHGTGEARIEDVELLDDHGRPVGVVAPESNLTVRVHTQYTETVDDSVVGIIVRNEIGLDVFSTNTALENTPVGRRRAGERVIVDFTFRVPLKNGHYSVVAAVARSGSEGSYLDWVSVAAVLEVSRPSGRDAFAGLIHLPTQVKVFEPNGARERELPG
jgi:ABC-type polysaccharide/polyol phosphate transport system ATPase subunit